ncbi:MAG: hypothetical protein ACJ8F7_03530 [Gemmataceae bacterium]
MAKSTSGNGKRINKSEAIRELLAQNPKAGSKEIVTQLSQRGIKVAPTLVYYIKSKQNHAARKAKRQRAVDKSGWTGPGNPVDLIVKVKALANEAGGIHTLKRLVDVLAE